MAYTIKLLLAAALVAMTAHNAAAAADDYPSRPIHIMVPYAPAGASDTAARLVVEPLAQQLGKRVIIENHGGGGGLNATEAYLKGNQDQDGYTILLGGIGPLTIIPAAKAVSYDPLKDFVPLGNLWRSALTLAVRPGLGVSSVTEFVAYAKAHPGQLTIGSAGVGSVTHLANELLKREAKIDLIHVPFHSTGETLPSLMGGQIDSVFGDTSVIAPQINAGTIIPLAVAGPKREPILPNVPTMAEAGLPRVEAVSWFGLVVSTRTPTAITKRLQEALVAAQKNPAYEESLAKMGASTGELGPESFGELIKKDAAKWKAIIVAAGIKFD